MARFDLQLTAGQFHELNRLLEQEQKNRDRARKRYVAQHPEAPAMPRKGLRSLVPIWALCTATGTLQPVPASSAQLPAHWLLVVQVTDQELVHLQQMVAADEENRRKARLRYEPLRKRPPKERVGEVLRAC